MRRISRNVKLHLVVTLILGALSLSAQGQIQLLERDVERDTTLDDFGRNSKHFASYYIGAGIYIGDKEGEGGYDLAKNRSRNFDFGFFYKRRFSELYSVVTEVAYRANTFVYSTSDTSFTSFPGSNKLVYSRMVVNNAHFALFNRFNYGDRGDAIGRYLDLGISADYGYMNKAREKWKMDNSAGYKVQKIERKQLDFVNPLVYSAEIKLGFEALVITGSYRLNDLIKKSENYQMPRMVIGLRVDMNVL